MDGRPDLGSDQTNSKSDETSSTINATSPGSNETFVASESNYNVFKPILNLDGQGFLPSRLAANWISDILKSHYNEPWPSWKKIPIRQRDLWFGELLAKMNGMPPTLIELFRHTHQRRKDNSWVDEKSEQVNAEFTRKFEELTQSASTQGITPPNELDVWCDVVGTKNGRIYGLGMESTAIRGWPYYHGTSSSNGWIQGQELEKLKKDLEGVKQERDELRIKIVNIERLFEENNAMI
ncbi:putative transposase [Vigna unguiculata]|uniref:Putative transposase n=1 Tax=Vigna unguiculata TaxID=3917 RepID=A0A4D6L221_VIGUN|nr:putative transposase [Vigna unguiculata]